MPIAPYLDKYFSRTGGAENRLKYPNPFFDMSRNYIPSNLKTLFGYCRTFFYRNGFLNSVVTKLTEYPITEVLFEQDIPPKVREKYEHLFNHQIKLKPLLIQIGLDYFTYGNCFISSYMKFDRYLKCPTCSEEHPIDEIKYKWSNFTFRGACPKCKAHDVTFTIVDNYLSSSEYLKFNRWSPENIDIDYDPISGESDYYYLIPNDTKKKIVSGDKKTLKRTPELFIRALKEKKRVELDKNNLYHFKRPTLAESDNGWGKPVILSAMQDIWYLQHLRRGNEAIASEHIVPFRVLYPSSQGNIDPLSQMNLSEWRGKLENELSLWKQDPNHISIFPIPIGQMNIGGDGKILTVTQEMKFIEESIINSLGVPLEFIKGGASWSGSSISLRIIENHFINYRTLLEDFINQFMVRNINKFLGYPVVKVKFKKLRMADDAESKRLTLELATAGKLSTPTLLGEFGYNFNEESENIQNTFKFESDLEQMRIIQQAEVQAKAMEIQAKGQVRAQLSANAEQARQREELFKEELANEVSKSTPSPESEKYDISTVIARYAEELQLLPQAQANALLGDLQKKYPYIYAMVMKRIQEQQLAMTAQAISSGVAPEMLMDQEEEGGSSSSSSSAKKPKRKLEEQKKKPGATKS